jgi:hypothetical protein
MGYRGQVCFQELSSVVPTMLNWRVQGDSAGGGTITRGAWGEWLNNISLARPEAYHLEARSVKIRMTGGVCLRPN